MTACVKIRIALQGGGRGGPAPKSELLYDIAGWAILVGIGIAWVSLARTEQAGAASSLK